MAEQRDLALALFAESLRRPSLADPHPPFLSQSPTRPVVDPQRAAEVLGSFGPGAVAPSGGGEGAGLAEWLVRGLPFELRPVPVPRGFGRMASAPSHCYEAVFPPGHAFDAGQVAREHGTLLGYHGSEPSNYHSILHKGLLVCKAKRGAFGDGVYLAEDPRVCFDFTSPLRQRAWRHSVFGGAPVVMLGFDVARHPVDVRTGSEQQSAPGYIVVSRDGLTRLRYVVVFASGPLRDSWVSAFAVIIAVVAILLCAALLQ
eukprot:m51a1_g6007 putative C-tail anchored protein (258) ;mRNA; f:42537-43510